MSLKNALGGILLIVGTSVGAGVLALPIATAQLGFWGAAGFYVLCWIFMTIGALCILEANLSAGFGTNMITMSEMFLGPIGKGLVWITYLILFYALTASYLSGAAAWVKEYFSYLNIELPTQISALISTLGILLIIVSGIRFTDWINRLLTIGLFVSFFILSGITLNHIEPTRLFSETFEFLVSPLPLIITAFGYAIVVPTLANYLHGRTKQLYGVILIGSAIPLVIYLLWEMIILGTLPLTGEVSLLSIQNSGHPATELPKQLDLQLHHPGITLAMSYFSVFALFSSILGVCISLFDFLADGLQIKKNKAGKTFLALITFMPPLVFVYFFPSGFSLALSFAGIFVSLLLGIFPALMVLRLIRKPSEKHRLGWIAQPWILRLTLCFFVGIILIECHNLYYVYHTL